MFKSVLSCSRVRNTQRLSAHTLCYLEGLWELPGRGGKPKWKEEDIVFLEACFKKEPRTYNSLQLAFIAQLSTLPPERLVYLDESGMDNRDEYDYGWIELGQRFHALKSGRREGRINMIAVLCNQNLIFRLWHCCLHRSLRVLEECLIFKNLLKVKLK